MADEEVADALRRSFLAGLPRDVVAELVAGGQRTDYPAGSTIYREGRLPGRCWSSKVCSARS
jgi:CRP/FNR family cyclic AMP-dependent transcriptional regulator